MSANRISQRIAAIAESATLKVDAKAKALKAEGKDVISFAAGEPDFATPQHIVEAAVLAVRDPKNHRYTPAAGLPELREAIVEKTKRDSGTEVAASQVIVTNGGKQAVYQAFAVILDPQDEVLVPAPYWTTYPEAIRLAGGVPVEVFAGADQNYKVTVEQLETARTPKSKVLLFVSPSNPTGSVYSKEELAALVKVFEKYPDIYILSDEIYEHINFVGGHQSMAQFDFIKDRVITINGVSKGFAMTGWRLGYIAANKEIAAANDKMQGQTTSGTCSIAQRAGIVAYEQGLETVLEMKKSFARRRELVYNLLNEIPGVKTNMPDGAFYFFPEISSFFGKKDPDGNTIKDSADLALYLLNFGHVATVGGDSFGNNNYIRLSYAASDESLVEALRRIKEALGKLS